MTLAERTGRGVSVAVIDSGVNPWHPHVGAVAGGIAIGPDGDEHDGFVDRLGHGTAVTAAIREHAPEAQLYAVRVFEQSLSTDTRVLVHAIDWASSRGMRLINLSLGTAKPEHEAMLRAAVDRAQVRGVLIVSACEHEGQRWMPGSLPGVVGVKLDRDCPRDEFRISTDSRGNLAFGASGYPRSIPGVPPEHNLKGISFAVANMTAFLARALEEHPEASSFDDALRVLRGCGQMSVDRGVR